MSNATTAGRALIIGSYVSPYVRKVLAVLEAKGVSYEIDPIVPFFGDDRFAQLSPLRRIPVLIDDLVTLADSSVICQYLEDRYPTPRLYPENLADRARARWLEEFADTRMGDVLIWRLFNEKVIKPFVWGRDTDQEALAHTLAVEVPAVLDYLEQQAPADGFIFGDVSIADISIAVFFRNAAYASFRIDGERWPRTAAFVDRVLNLPNLSKLRGFEDLLMRTPPAKQRAALRDAGAPLSAETYGTAKPRPGVMSV